MCHGWYRSRHVMPTLAISSHQRQIAMALKALQAPPQIKNACAGNASPAPSPSGQEEPGVEVKLVIQTASARAAQQLDALQRSANNTDLQHLIAAQGVPADAGPLPPCAVPSSCGSHAVKVPSLAKHLPGMHHKDQHVCLVGLQTSSIIILGSSVGANAAPKAAPLIAAAATLAQPPMQVPAQAPDTAAAAAAAAAGGGAVAPAAGAPAQVLHASMMPAATL